ncbi:hypothetical protein BO71DRAFT_415712 [Aspergillus ellipticus CBS 707.79]|uniref:Uncharacterized protein n=1 Tax=Aspergillus ellipticus CBS 707.79 TaxID=1448320 RepID=A0A319DP73_9EURO|nr:hypothetical protein BO71DRAFT_415712 [Aspergillus ellipticus CBS 707.79]
MAVQTSASRANQNKEKRKARCKLRQERSYDADIHRVKDAQRSGGRASPKTKEGYRKRVRYYKEFLKEEKGLPEDYKVGVGYRVPGLEELKEFICWHIDSTVGRLDPDGRPTMNSTLVWAQEFIPGFFFETRNEIPYQDRQDLYSWIKHDLVAEQYIKNIKKLKYNFKLKSFKRAIVTFWTINNLFFMTGRYRIQFYFITLQNLCVGSRVSSLTPASENKAGRDLCYKNIKLVLFRDTEAPWRIRWHPENTIFSTAIWDCDEPIYSGVLYLLGMALTDNTLFRFSSTAEVFEQRIPEGEDELILRWNNEARDRCIVRGISATGVSEDPFIKERYQEGLRKCLANAGYFVTATIHAMRCELGKAVRAKYSSTLVAQILTHKSKSVYGNDYLGNCSSVDVVNSLKGRPLDHTHVDYFQGFERFHENGLIRRLPIEEEQKIDEDPSLTEISAKIEGTQSADESRRLRREYSIQRRKIYSKAFQQYQSDWVRNRRDWKILTRGRERPNYIEQAAEKQVLCKLMPELGRLAAVISSNQSLSFDEKASVVHDIHTHCLRELDVVYLPDEELQEGRCQVPACIKYCWECYTYYDRKSCKFEEHCAGHLPSITSQHYEPSECPDPSCNHISKEEQDYRRHLHDVHHYHKAIYVAPKEAPKKRSSATLDEKTILDCTQSMQHKHPHKRRKNTPNSPPCEPKELKIKFWQPCAIPTEPLFSERPQVIAWEIKNCQSTVTLDDGRNSVVLPSVALDTPDLTDDSSTCSSPSAVCSTSSALDFDSQLLKVSQPYLSQPNKKTDQSDTCTYWEQGEHQELPGEDVTLPSMDIISIRQTSSSSAKPSEESASYLEGDSSMCHAERSTVEESGLTGPVTRAKAREQATKSPQKSTDLHSLRREALSYSRDEDELLILLMRELAAFGAVTPAFQKRFPNRSASSLRKRWSLIQPSPRRSTRSKILKEP